MPVLKLNIGLNVGGVPTLNAVDVARALTIELRPFIVGPSMFSVQVAKSGEETLTAAVMVQQMGEVELSYMIHKLCSLFAQDCIAGIYGDRQFLIGPVTEPYGGAFNVDYWLEPRAIDPKLVALRELIEAFDNFTMAEDDKARMVETAKVNAIRAKLRRVGGF